MAAARNVALVLVLSVVAMGLTSFAASPARAANVAIGLYGSATGGWGTSSASESTPGPTLTVNVGDSVTITLHSTDGFQHEFFVDYNGNGMVDAGEPASSAFSNTTTFTFVASQAGSFTYKCLFHPSVMMGSFVVQSAGGTANPATISGNTLLIVGVVIVVVVGAGAAVLALQRRSRGT